jgi:hypothetical protein
MSFVFNYSGSMDNAVKLIDAAADVPDAVKKMVKERVLSKGDVYQHLVSVRGTEMGDTYSFTLSVKSTLPVPTEHMDTPTRVNKLPK